MPNANTVATILKKFEKSGDNPFFTVKRERLYRADGQDTGHDALFRKDNKRQLSVVSKGYGLVTHREAVDFAQKLLTKSGVKTDDAVHKSVMGSDGKRLFHQMVFPHYAFDASKETGVRNTAFDGQSRNDSIVPVITMRNSYDGTSPVSFDGGGLRLACLNGMQVRKDLYRIKLAHKGNVDLSKLAPDFVEQIAYVVDGLKRDYERLNQESGFETAQQLFLEQQISLRYLHEIERMLANHIVVNWEQPEKGKREIPVDIVKKSDFSRWALYCIITNVATHRAKTVNVANALQDKAANLFLSA